MRKRLNYIISFLLFAPLLAMAQTEAGEALFKQKCAVCHKMGGGRHVGPDLAGVTERREKDWIKSFVNGSQAMIASGDADAVALFKEFNEVPMPDQGLSDAEFSDLYAYLETGATAAAEPVAAVSVLDDAGPADVELGAKLFDGRVAFANGGPSCISCHNTSSSYLFNDKGYAKGISASFANMGEEGVKGIISQPPFPVMAKAFENKELEEGEVRALLAFLKSLGGEQEGTASAGVFDSTFLIYGLLGAVALVILYSLLWFSRKDRTVNNKIYNRQIKSLN